MPVSRQGIRLAVALLVCLSVLGCSRGRGSQVAEPQSSISSSERASSTTEPESGRTQEPTADAPSGATPGQDPQQPSNRAPGAPGGSSGSQPKRAPGAPSPPGGGDKKPQAPGAPLKIPTIEQKGIPIGQVLESIRQEFVDACGGSLCVNLVISPSTTNQETDELVGTNPPEDSVMTPGMTVELVCAPPEEEQPPEETPPDDTAASGGNTVPDDGQPASDS